MDPYSRIELVDEREQQKVDETHLCSAEQVNGHWGTLLSLNLRLLSVSCNDAQMLINFREHSFEISPINTFFFLLFHTMAWIRVIRFCIIVYSRFTPLHCNLTVCICLQCTARSPLKPIYLS